MTSYTNIIKYIYLFKFCTTASNDTTYTLCGRTAYETKVHLIIIFFLRVLSSNQETIPSRS